MCWYVPEYVVFYIYFKVLHNFDTTILYCIRTRILSQVNFLVYCYFYRFLVIVFLFSCMSYLYFIWRWLSLCMYSSGVDEIKNVNQSINAREVWSGRDFVYIRSLFGKVMSIHTIHRLLVMNAGYEDEYRVWGGFLQWKESYGADKVSRADRRMGGQADGRTKWNRYIISNFIDCIMSVDDLATLSATQSANTVMAKFRFKVYMVNDYSLFWFCL